MTDQATETPQGTRNLVEINDLPIYPERRIANVSKTDDKSNQLENKVREVRHSLVNNLSFLGDAFEVSRGYYHHDIGKSKELYESLTDEKEQTTKIIAITSGGLLGLTLSLRKDIFKKLIYSSFFAGSVAAFCYPSKAKEYADIVSYITKNKIPPVVKEYTGIDLDEQFKNLNESLPDLSSLKSLWNDQKKPNEKSNEKKN